MGLTFWKNKYFMLPVVLFFAAGLAILLNIGHGDEIFWFNSLRHEPNNSLATLITWLGDGWWLAGVVTILLFFDKKIAILLAIMGLATMPISYTLKDKIGADRPKTYFEKKGSWQEIKQIPNLNLPGGQTSFPSGHTTTAFSMYALLCSFLPKNYEKYGAACAILAILVAISRIFLVCHFLVDVLGGAILGLVLASFFEFLGRKMLQNNV